MENTLCRLAAFLRREKLSISVVLNDVGRGTVVCVKRFIGCMKNENYYTVFVTGGGRADMLS